MTALAVLAACLLAPAPDAEDSPRPALLLAWPAGPLEVRIAFDRPVGADLARTAVGRTIPFFEPDAPGTARSGRPSKPLGLLRIAGARLADEGRTLVLATDPHPREAVYRPDLPGLPGAGALAYTLGGVETRWSAGDGEGPPAWTVATANLGLDVLWAEAATSAEHRRAFEDLAKPGRLALSTLVRIPKGRATLRFRADAPFEITSVGVATPSAEVGGRHEAALEVESDGEPIDLAVSLATGRGGRRPALTATFEPEGDRSKARPIAPARLVLPWAPPMPPAAGEPPAPPYDLAGGDPARGEAVFRGEEAKCAVCHKARGQGGEVGPDLSSQVGRDRAAVYRDIAEPGTVLHPEFVQFTVARKDGSVASGVVRADGPDAIRVVDAEAKATIVPKSEIEELRPSTASLMPVGLAGALGEARMRHLIAFLTAPPEPARSGR